LRQHELNDIINSCKSNNAKAQERLYKHYFALMYSICKRFSENQQTVISLVNEGFLKVFRNIQHFDTGKGNFESWAKKIITNTAIDHARSQNKNRLVELEEDNVRDTALSVSARNSNHIEEEVLYLIKKMGPVTQRVFSLHVFEGFSHKEIAQILGMAESTSRWHVSEARKNLRQQAHKIY